MADLTRRNRTFGSDVTVRDVEVVFSDVTFDQPLRLASETITGYSLVIATATIKDRAGTASSGCGAGVLSVPWAWPASRLSFEVRDLALREIAVRAAQWVRGAGPSDPIAIYDEIVDALPAIVRTVEQDANLNERVPPLSATLAIAALDNAIHDAWSRASGRSAYRLYYGAQVRADLRLLRPTYRSRLPVQHVVGLADALTSADATPRDRSLERWVRDEGIDHVKVKVSGGDPDGDADRVAAVGAILGTDPSGERSLSIDANEGADDLSSLSQMLDRLRVRAPKVFEQVRYIEQPIPRHRRLLREDVRAADLDVPMIVDEGFATLADLAALGESGWSGLAVKAARGQSLAVRSWDWATRHGAFVTIQDLTAVDIALEHSARLASAFPYSHPAFEYNSRQYAPGANAELATRRPSLVGVAAGSIAISPRPGPGIY